MESPATPVGHNGTDQHMEDRSDDGDETNLDDTMTGGDGEGRGEKLSAGRAWVEADGPTDYSLYSNPPSLGLIRQRLFDVEDSIEMSPADFDAYFPFVDNVWRKTKGSDGTENSAGSETYWCRLRKPSNQKPYVPKPTPEGKTSRKKRIREDKTCPMAIKVVRRDGPVKTCNIFRAVGPDVQHTHDLDHMDSIKRNTGIMDVARREAVKGFLPGSVYWKMQEEPDKLEEAGGKFMKISDARNVQYAWRQENPDLILKAHNGYSQTSRGPKPKLASPAAVSQQHAPTPKKTPNIVPQHIPPQHMSPQRAPLHLTPVQHAPTHSAPPHHPPQPGPAHSAPPHHPSQPVPTQQGPPQHAAATQGPDNAPSSIASSAPGAASRGTLQYPDVARGFLEPYLPRQADIVRRNRPHVTLTWATSLDARISLMPGIQTAISGLETKAMTHYLRSRHDAILIGVRTAMADDPSLNCRLEGAGGYGGAHLQYQPRPIIIDPHARLHIRPEMKVLRVVSEGRAKGPWIVISPTAKLHPTAVQTLKHYGGEYLMIQDIDPQTGQFNWESIFDVLIKEGINSVMVEGGGRILSDLLKPRYTDWIDSTILTIAPTFFGREGTNVAPETARDRHGQPFATRLNHVRWQPMGDSDVVMCGRMRYEGPPMKGMLPGIAEFSQGPPPPHPQHGDYAPPAQNGHTETSKTDGK